MGEYNVFVPAKIHPILDFHGDAKWDGTPSKYEASVRWLGSAKRETSVDWQNLFKTLVQFFVAFFWGKRAWLIKWGCKRGTLIYFGIVDAPKPVVLSEKYFRPMFFLFWERIWGTHIFCILIGTGTSVLVEGFWKFSVILCLGSRSNFWRLVTPPHSSYRPTNPLSNVQTWAPTHQRA